MIMHYLNAKVKEDDIEHVTQVREKGNVCR
jgi:hypothetical protein